MRDIVGVFSFKRLTLLLLLLVGFVIAQTLLHFAYLTTETNRAIFSSYRHFKSSEDAEKDPGTIFLIVINGIFGLIYCALYIFEAIRSFLDFQRLRFSQKVGHLISIVMALTTLVVLFSKASRQGGFST